MEKYIFYQTEPGYQESPFYIDSCYGLIDGLMIQGNRLYRRQVFGQTFERLNESLESCICDCIDVMEGYNTNDTVTDILQHYFDRRYSNKDISYIKKLFTDWDNFHQSNNEFCEIARTITKKDIHWTTLRGCCQGDWVDVFYDAQFWSAEDLERLEIEFFNQGTEYILQDDGCAYYCHGINDEDNKEELTGELGCKPEQITLFNISGYRTTPIYTEV